MGRVAVKKLVIIFVFITLPLSGFPYRFVRLIEVNSKGTVEKTINFIFDAHFPLAQRTKKIPVRENIDPQKWNQQAAIERALIKILEEIAAQNGEKIELLWELSEKAALLPDEGQFLLYLGKKLASEFSKNKNKRLQFIFGDQYRDNIVGFDLTAVYTMKKWNRLRGRHVGELINYLDTIMVTAEKDVMSVIALESVQGEISKKGMLVLNYFNNYVMQMNAFRKKFGLEPELFKINDHIGDWLNRLKPIMRNEFASEWYDMIIDKTMDLELLIRIIASSTKQIIVYAGGAHCLRVMNELIKNFGFKKVTNIGSDYGTYEDIKYLVPLSHSAWFYLKETPVQSLKRSPVDAVQSSDLFKLEGELDSIIDKALANKQQGLDDLSDIFVSGYRTHIDLVNMQYVLGKKTLLHLAAQQNIIPVIELLLKHGALTNIQDAEGNTPLHYAQSAQAAQLLLNHGARSDIINNKNQIPLHVAIINDNSDVARALLEKGADPNSLLNDEQGLYRPLALTQPGSDMEKLLLEYGARESRKQNISPTKKQLDRRSQSIKKLFND